MGICLDTEQHNNGSEDFDGTYRQQRGGSSEWHQQNPHEFRYTSTPPNGQFPMHNGGTVQFEPPKVPVIFVLGGPGSGKVTHCDNLMQEKRGIAHINMTDLLQQYAIGNDMQDFGQLSSKTVTEVLMLEMKMSPNAKTYLVSGYPRNMRDVVEYSEKIQVINGVILVAWRQKVLERQIDYGAKLGQVVLSLARMELNNFYKNVMPVADYFDQSGILITVNGERHPGEVYKDFRDAVIRILGQQDVPPDLPNGRPAAITDNVEPIVDQSTHPQRMIAPPPIPQIPQSVPMVPAGAPLQRQQPPSNSDVITVRAHDSPMFNSPVKPGWPPVIWVIGGPGSNKATLCSQSIRQNPGWIHFSLGKLLRAAAESGSSTDARVMRDHISAGEMVPSDLAMQMIETHMGANITASGIIIDGFPRDIKQAGDFEAKFRQRPSMVLLDCSKLQLGRGRLDDSVSAFRRRLELFREVSLPMLKTMDNDGRLSIVDGDTGSAKVQEDFNRVIRQIIDESQSDSGNQGRQQQVMNNANNQMSSNRPPVLPNGMAAAVLRNQRDPIVEDLESLTGIETVSRRVANGGQQLLNGFAAMNGRANGAPMANGHNIGNGYANGVANGFVNRAARLVSPSTRNQVGDLYTTVANQRMNNMRNMYDMDYQANHI